MRKIKVFLCLLLVIGISIFLDKTMADDELPDDGAEISSVQVIQTKTGTGPWDDNDDAGNDSSEDNDIVRSFDQVTWTIENTMGIKNQSAESYTGGKIYFEATLPSDKLSSDTAEWDLDSMQWVEDAKLSSDKLTLSGYYSMSTENTTVPGKQTLVFICKVLGAKNGTQFQPTIKVWLNGNSEEDKKEVVPDLVKVSAAPKYNIVLQQNSYMQSKLTVDYGQGDTLGRMYGYGVMLELYNDSPSKQLKGIEYPQGEITYDIDLLFERTKFESQEKEDITDVCTPILWNYKLNDMEDYGVIPDRIMNFVNRFNKYYNGMPLGVKQSERRFSVYDSGNYSVTQNGSKLSFKINDYKFDGNFPIWDYGWGNLKDETKYTDNIGCFSVGYFEVFVPDNEESTINDRNYYLTLTDNNFKATSLSGDTVTSQAVDSDDTVTLQHVIYKPGSYYQDIWFTKPKSTTLIGTTKNARGDGYVALGERVDILVKFGISVTNDYDINSAAKFVKFDGDAYEPSFYSDGTNYFKTSFNGDMEFKVYYVTKPDGSNWSSQTEMNKANIEDMNVYESLEDIPDGYTCIGEYLESTTGTLTRNTGDNNTVLLPVRIKESATVGRTYGVTHKTVYYKDYLDRSVYNIMNKDNLDDYPTPEWDSGNPNYVKTEYNESGTMIPGTHNGGTHYGNALLVVAGTIKVQKTALDDDGNEKVNYDISKNEYEVNYKITPILTKPSSLNLRITDITVIVKDTLPSGLTYVAGTSNYGEPEIEKNDDGSTTLTWTITGCELGVDVNPITYKAHISEYSLNGQQYTNKVVVNADKIGTIEESQRTSTNTINIVNLSSHRLYKTIETPVIERNGDIHYKISYKNNTNAGIPDFRILDILPYNGDSRGTSFNGTYTLDRLVITQEDSDGNTLSNDNLNILYTNDESAKTANSKDENLGENWIETSSENIAQEVTAFAIKGKIAPNAKLDVDIYLKTNGNKGLDKYVNSATSQVYADTDEMQTSDVISQVIQRKIEGVMWYDENNNGIKDDSESLASNVKVTLTDENGEQVTDINGDVISSVTTDENGHYEFVDLPKGNYYVKTEMPEDKYILTEKEVGINTTVNSKFNVDNNQTDEITKLNTTDLPELTVSNVNAGFIKKETKVIVNHVEVGTNTKLLDEETINGRIDDSYETTQKLDEINEKYNNKYEYVKIEGNATGLMTEDTIYVTYYYQKKKTDVVVRHVTDTGIVLQEDTPIIGKIDDEYTTHQENFEKYEIKTIPDNANGTMTQDRIIVTYVYTQVFGKVTLTKVEKEDSTKAVIGAKYKIESEDKEVSQEKETDENGKITFENLLVGKYTITEVEAPRQYSIDTKSYNVEITKTNRNIEVNTTDSVKVAKIVINHVDINSNEKLLDEEERTGRIDVKYTTTQKLDEINNKNDNKYEYVKVEGNANGTFEEETQYITYYYQKKATDVVVRHVTDTGIVLQEDTPITGRIDDEYTTHQEEFEKYEIKTIPENANGTMQKDRITVTYVYTQVFGKITLTKVEDEETKAPVVGAKYKLESEDKTISQEKETDSNGKIVFENLPVGKYTITEIEAPRGYEIETKVINTEITKELRERNVDTSDKVVYSKVIVNHVDIDTNEKLLDEQEINGRLDEKYTTTQKLDEINKKYEDKYEYVKVEGEQEGEIEENTKYITYYYQKKKTDVVVRHVTDRGIVLQEDKPIEGRIDDSYTTHQETFKGYEIKTIPDNAVGTMQKDRITVTYVYTQILGSITITKTDKDDSSKFISGAKYRLESEDKSITLEGTTDEEGKLVFEGLPIGKYTITEIEAPIGYELDNNTIEVEITEDERNIELKATNKLKEVPNTSDINVIAITLVVLVSIYGIAITRKRILSK